MPTQPQSSSWNRAKLPTTQQSCQPALTARTAPAHSGHSSEELALPSGSEAAEELEKREVLAETLFTSGCFRNNPQGPFSSVGSARCFSRDKQTGICGGHRTNHPTSGQNTAVDFKPGRKNVIYPVCPESPELWNVTY